MDKACRYTKISRSVIAVILVATVLLAVFNIKSSTASSSSAKIVVSAPWAVYNGATCDVTISLTKSIPACMLQFTITYDAACFDVVETEAGAVFDTCGTPTINASRAGKIILCWDGITPLTTKGALLVVALRAKKITNTTCISISNKDEFICGDGNFSDIPIITQQANMAVVDTEYKIGDVNRDRKVNTGDAVMVLRFTVGLCSLSNAQSFLGDYNKDAKLNSGDACAILRACVNLSVA